MRACGLHRVCTRRQKSKQQINSHCCQLHLQGLHVYGLKKCHLPLPPPQTVLKVSARVEKSVPLYRGDNEFSILTGGTFTFKTVSPRLSEKSRRELKRMYPTTGAATNSQSSLGVLLLLRQSPPYRSICVAHVFSKTTFSSGLMITKLKSNTKTTGWNKRPGASPTLTTRRNSPGTSRESIANQKDF